MHYVDWKLKDLKYFLAPYPIKRLKKNQIWKFRETILPIEIQHENIPSYYISWVNMMNFFWKMASKSFIFWPFVRWGDYHPQFCTLSMAVTVLNYESQVLSRVPVYAINFMHWYSLMLEQCKLFQNLFGYSYVPTKLKLTLMLDWFIFSAGKQKITV